MIIEREVHVWEDYVWWRTRDRKVLTRINALIREISRNGHDGIGKPEPLRYGFAGYWVPAHHR